MPEPWQTRGSPQAANHHTFGAPARSIGEILTSPFHQLLSSKLGKIALAITVLFGLLILIF